MVDRISIENEVRHEALGQIGKGKSQPILSLAGDRDELPDLRRAEAGIGEGSFENVPTVLLCRPFEHDNVRRTPEHGGINRGKPIRTHYDGRRELAHGEIIDAADQGVDSGAVLMVHLRCFARLCQRIGLVDEQDAAGTRFSLPALRLRGLIGDLSKRRAEQSRRLPLKTRTTRRETEPE